MIGRNQGLERTALLVAGSVGAGVHAGLAPEHLHEWLPLGVAFIAAAVALMAAVAVVAIGLDDAPPRTLSLLLLGVAGAYAATRIAALPPLDPAREALDPLGLATSAIESAGAIVGLRLSGPHHHFATPQGGTP
jgi:hypothetical protein